jgi:mercuric ion binding protein
MRSLAAVLALAAILGSGPPAAAADRTVTLRVMHMTCALCPIIVRKAIETIPGVAQIDVSMESGTATVVYNEVATNPTELAETIANAGYPAWPIKHDR